MQQKDQTRTVPVQSRSTASSSAQSGIATEYWLELKAYPAGSARSLWLNVGNQWVRLDDPSESIERRVSEAFIHPDKLEVKAWYSDEEVVGLVVKNKK